ncbi:hypothetical protein ACFPRL_29870 [Pseudoclavibacter helvolus]
METVSVTTLGAAAAMAALASPGSGVVGSLGEPSGCVRRSASWFGCPITLAVMNAPLSPPMTAATTATPATRRRPVRRVTTGASSWMECRCAPARWRPCSSTDASFTGACALFASAPSAGGESSMWILTFARCVKAHPWPQSRERTE